MGGRILYNGLVCLALASCITALPVAANATALRTDFHFSGKPGTSSNPLQDNILQVNGEDEINQGALSFIENMGQQAIGFLSNSALDVDEKKASFRGLLQESFDMKTIGRFSLGRYWRVSTPEQRKEYQNLFEKMVIDVYSQRFSEYRGQKFETRGFRMDGPNDTIVTSFIVPDTGPEVQVDWRVRHKNGEFRVIDVIVEGVSMSVTQRSDFSSVIQRGGGDVQVLLTHLRGQ